jgi:hypothetical protein
LCAFWQHLWLSTSIGTAEVVFEASIIAAAHRVIGDNASRRLETCSRSTTTSPWTLTSGESLARTESLAHTEITANNARAMPHERPPTGTAPIGSGDPSTRSPPIPRGPLEQPLFRFDLRQLLWFVALLSGLMAVVVSLPGLIAAALLLATLVIAAHLFSTALASRLRAQADEAQQRGATCNTSPTPRDAARSTVAVPSSKRSPWHRRGGTALPWLPRLILAGVATGGTIGAFLLAATIGHRTSAAGIIVGSASLAVVGGWIAFLCGSFYGIFRHGLREALAEQKKDETPHPVV